MARWTEKQRRFVDEYMVDFNGTQAAIRAGYSPASARDIASENLMKPHIADEIARRQAELSKRCGITQERIIQELARIAFARMDTFAEWSPKGVTLKDSKTLSADDLAAIAEISEQIGKVRKKMIKLHDKQRALELLGKYLGMFEKDDGDAGEGGDLVINVVYGPPPPTAPAGAQGGGQNE